MLEIRRKRGSRSKSELFVDRFLIFDSSVTLCYFWVQFPVKGNSEVFSVFRVRRRGELNGRKPVEELNFLRTCAHVLDFCPDAFESFHRSELLKELTGASGYKLII